MRKNINDVRKILLWIVIIALVKLLVEKMLAYFSVPSDVARIVSALAWVILAIASFLFIRNWLVTYRENRQSKDEENHSYEMYFPGNSRERGLHTEIIKADFKGLYWQLRIKIPEGGTLQEYQNSNRKMQGVEIKNVEGPYCPNDECKMRQEKTYFGKYRFRCPYCDYKNKSKDNNVTLSHHLRNVLDLKEIIKE